MRGTIAPRWDVLDLMGVREVARQAARRVHGRYTQHVELEDLQQDALLAIATTQNLLDCLADDEGSELGLLQYRLEQVLVKGIEATVRRQERTISYSTTEGDDELLTFLRPYVAIETASSDYTRDSVESLLPAVWDEDYCYGMPQRDDAPDHDMPKGSTNKARGNNLSAYIADIKTGWDKTPLTAKERRALLLAFGLGWTQKEVAFNQGVSQQTIQERIHNAVGKIVARLNGGLWYELEGIEA